MTTHRPRASSLTNRRAAWPRQAFGALAVLTTAALGLPAHAADPATALGQVAEVRAMRRLAAQALRPMIGFDRLEGQPELQQHAIADFYRRVVRVQQATRAYARRGGLAGDFAYQIDAAYQNLVHRDYRGPLSPSLEKTRLAARYLVRGLYLSGVAAPSAEEGLGGRVLRELRELERVDRALTNLFTLEAPQTRRTPPVVVTVNQTANQAFIRPVVGR